eukprot:TRINITY_DN10804_c0_g1_i1.p1 TRINITY_DN10804_c0_g1~~TRINITY_DN10804_c0_g1_i1.p1  ORF type:complete len:258 (-),score=31.76 TRINITY_DN10804_c0_g1_i1:514-1287(-)
MEATPLSSRAACCKVATSVSYSDTSLGDFRGPVGRQHRAAVRLRARRGTDQGVGICSLGAKSVFARNFSASLVVARGTMMESALPQKQEVYTVGDFMTPLNELLVAKKTTTVDEALESLVENRITGMPVVDDNGILIGVVSDYDLLALDSISGKPPTEMGFFPEPGRTWKAFKEIQRLLLKTNGITVGEVMTPSPLVVREMTNLEDAARLLLDSKYRRLPVVDDQGKLVGLLTRGNVVRAALVTKRAAAGTLEQSRP